MPTAANRWTSLTLPGQFLLAGAAVMLAAMLVVGHWVSSQIQEMTVQNAAINSAVFVESFVAPVLRDLNHSGELSDTAKQSLIEIFDKTSLSDRVVSYKVWVPGGKIVHASNPDVIDSVFEPSGELLAAFAGQVVPIFKGLNNPESQAEALLNVPLMEVYLPLRETLDSDVNSVFEFYVRADQLAKDLFSATLRSWVIVGFSFLLSGMLLFGIVLAGGRKIRQQREQLKSQLLETRLISGQNAMLKKKAVSASARASAKADRTLRQLGADLHDGPAQYLSLAALRLENAFPDSPENNATLDEIRASLNKAMSEIRSLSRGLALPDLDTQKLGALVEKAIHLHKRQSDTKVSLSIQGNLDLDIDYAQKLCVFRFLQEALSNATRHAPDAAVSVYCRVENHFIEVVVIDDGPGFDIFKPRRVGSTGGQGLLGLRDRVESIGGLMRVESRMPGGTTLSINLPVWGDMYG